MLRRAGSGHANEVGQALSVIVTNGNRATDVLSRIRAFIKKAPPHNDSLDVNQAILEVVALTRSEAKNNKVAIQLKLAEAPPVQADRVQLQQVILNLILNAIEAMSASDAGSRRLLISSAKSESDDVSVEAPDSGPGFPCNTTVKSNCRRSRRLNPSGPTLA
jgi:C4-dicarboxylate-specific signal transduction histidine kinase